MDLSSLKATSLPGRWQRKLVRQVEAAWNATHSDHGGVPDEFARLLQQDDSSLPYDAFVRFLALRLSRHHWEVGTSSQTKWATGDHVRKQRSIPRAYAPLLQALRRVTLAGIVTTNYDLVFEKILGPTDSGRLGGFNYGSPGGQLRGTHAISSRYSYKAPPITGTIPLLKLHGSLNWGLGPDGKLETYVDCRPSRGLRYTPVLLPPGRSAEGIALQQVWKSAKDTLTAASTWIVCGYSVPDYDSDVRDLLEASAKELRRVVVLDPEANSVAAKVRNLLRGRASRIDYICGGALVPEVSPRELRALILGGEWTEAPAW